MVAALNYKTPFLFQKNVSGAPFSQDFTSPSRDVHLFSPQWRGIGRVPTAIRRTHARQSLF